MALVRQLWGTPDCQQLLVVQNTQSWVDLSVNPGSSRHDWYSGGIIRSLVDQLSPLENYNCPRTINTLISIWGL